MYEITADTLINLKISTRLVAEELLNRGYVVSTFQSVPALLDVDLPQSTQPMRIYSVIGESMSFIAGRAIAGNKQVTNRLLARMGISVPAELYILFDEILEKKEDIETFIATHGTVVVKPIDGAHGKHVYVNVSSVEEVILRAGEMVSDSKANGFTVQTQLTGKDLRIICIDGTYASAMIRVPAFVIGDGISSIQDLIEIENRNDYRGNNYSVRLNKIDHVRAHDYLGAVNMHRIPSEGEYVEVMGIANIGAGGERRNVDDNVPVFLRELAEAIAHELRLPICGVDFFVDKIPELSDNESMLNPVVLEVNNCPGITMYEELDGSSQRALTKRLVDSLVRSHLDRYPNHPNV